MESRVLDPDPRPSPNPRRSRLNLRTVALLIVLVALGEAAVIGYVFLTEQATLWRDRNKTETHLGPTSNNRFVYVADGISTPPAVAAASARLSDDEEILAIVVDGKRRAYRLSAMKGREQHIINDVIDGIPVGVTYCDAAECVRGFRGEPGGPPLGIALGGLVDGNRLVLRIDGHDYFQDTGEPADSPGERSSIPFKPLKVERLKWKAWREAHPDGDVYVGDFESIR